MSRRVVGIHAVRSALRTRPEDVEKLFVKPGGPAGEIAELAKKLGVRFSTASHEQLERMSAGEIHQGVVAELGDFKYLEVEDLLEAVPEGTPPLLVVLDGIEDPHNLGAILRSAEVLGAHGVILPKDRAAGVTPAVGRAAAGALETARIAQVVNLSRTIEMLKERGLWFAVADQEAKQAVWEADLKGPLGIVVGAEGKGVRPLVRSHCDLAVRIPMEGKTVGLVECQRGRSALAVRG